MTRGPSSERMAGVVGGAAAVTESETGLAPRVAKFQCEMWEDQPAVFSALTRALYWVAGLSDERNCFPAQWYPPSLLGLTL